MAATISEEVSARFTADSTGLVKAVDTAKSKLAELRQAYSARTAAGNIKNTLLEPQLLVDKGLDKLLTKAKFSAGTVGVLAAGFAVAASALAKFRDEATAANQATLALDESVRKLTNANTFTSPSEGAGALAGKLASLREEGIALRADADRLNPMTNFGKNVLETQYAMTRGSPGDVLGSQALANDRAKNASQQDLVGKQSAQISRQLPESLQQQNRLTDLRVSGDQQTLQIAQLRIQKEREINDLKASGVAYDKDKDGNTNLQLLTDRFDLEIKAQERLKIVAGNRRTDELLIANLKTSGLSADQQAIRAAQIRVEQVKVQLELQKDLLTTEEKTALRVQQIGDMATITLAQRKSERATGGSLKPRVLPAAPPRKPDQARRQANRHQRWPDRHQPRGKRGNR